MPAYQCFHFIFQNFSFPNCFVGFSRTEEACNTDQISLIFFYLSKVKQFLGRTAFTIDVSFAPACFISDFSVSIIRIGRCCHKAQVRIFLLPLPSFPEMNVLTAPCPCPTNDADSCSGKLCKNSAQHDPGNSPFSIHVSHCPLILLGNNKYSVRPSVLISIPENTSSPIHQIKSRSGP